MEPDTGAVAPDGTAVFQFRDGGGNLVSEAGVGAIVATRRARVFVDTNDTQTGIAVASPGNGQTRLTFRLKAPPSGKTLEVAERVLPAAGQLAVFTDQFFEMDPPGGTGVVEIEAQNPVIPITSKLSENGRGDLILTTLPVADLARDVASEEAVFPQIGFGLGFTTRLLVISSATSDFSEVEILFVTSSGGDLIPPEETDSRIIYGIGPGGAAEFRPGAPVSATQLLIDPTGPFSGEIVVNAESRCSWHPS